MLKVYKIINVYIHLTNLVCKMVFCITILTGLIILPLSLATLNSLFSFILIFILWREFGVLCSTPTSKIQRRTLPSPLSAHASPISSDGNSTGSQSFRRGVSPPRPIILAFTLPSPWARILSAAAQNVPRLQGMLLMSHSPKKKQVKGMNSHQFLLKWKLISLQINLSFRSHETNLKKHTSRTLARCWTNA